MNAETQKVDVVRVSDAEVLRSNVHPVVGENLARDLNRFLYNRGPYCEVRPALGRVGSDL